MTTIIVVTVLCALAICVGLLGIVFPVLPGSILIWISSLVWAIFANSTPTWIVFAVITVCVAAGMASSWVLTGRKLTTMKIPKSTLLISGVLALVGFFLIPVVGLLLGFVVGLFVMEYQRLKDTSAAWASSWAILKTAALGIVVELGFASIAALAFAVGCFVYFT